MNEIRSYTVLFEVSRLPRSSFVQTNVAAYSIADAIMQAATQIDALHGYSAKGERLTVVAVGPQAVPEHYFAAILNDLLLARMPDAGARIS